MTGWVGQLLGLDAESFTKNGVIQGTASESALIATIAARERAIRLLLAKGAYASREEILPKMVMYGSTQTHSLGAKAGLVLGIQFRALETAARDSWALRGDTFEQAIKEDKAKGLIPFMLSACLPLRFEKAPHYADISTCPRSCYCWLDQQRHDRLHRRAVQCW